jgi:hypothetical protein
MEAFAENISSRHHHRLVHFVILTKFYLSMNVAAFPNLLILLKLLTLILVQILCFWTLSNLFLFKTPSSLCFKTRFGDWILSPPSDKPTQLGSIDRASFGDWILSPPSGKPTQLGSIDRASFGDWILSPPSGKPTQLGSIDRASFGDWIPSPPSGKPTQLGSIDRASPYLRRRRSSLRNVVF